MLVGGSLSYLNRLSSDFERKLYILAGDSIQQPLVRMKNVIGDVANQFSLSIGPSAELYEISIAAAGLFLTVLIVWFAIGFIFGDDAKNEY